MQFRRESRIPTANNQNFTAMVDRTKLFEGVIQFFVCGVPVKKTFRILEASIPKVGICIVRLQMIDIWVNLPRLCSESLISGKRSRQLIASHRLRGFAGSRAHSLSSRSPTADHGRRLAAQSPLIRSYLLCIIVSRSILYT